MNIIHATDREKPIQCAIPGCGEVFLVKEMASLTDKNGHGWLICPDCVDGMWVRRPYLPIPESHSSPVIIASAQALPELIGSVSVLVDTLQTTDEGNAKVIAAIHNALDHARKAYRENV